MESLFFFIDAVIFNSLGLILVALGALISFRFVGFPDLTIDGSFTFGAALYALSIAHGVFLVPALMIAMIGGALGGAMTGVLNRYVHIGQIISGIIVMIFLILLVPYFSGNATVGLLSVGNILTDIAQIDRLITDRVLPNAAFSLHLVFSSAVILIVCMLVWILHLFFKSTIGIMMRYVGSAHSPDLIPESRQTYLIIGGLMMSNALIALGGAIEAEQNAGFSQNMGIGIMLIAIAVLVLGESVWKAYSKRANLYVYQQLAATVTGVLIYATVVQAILFVSVSFVDIRLLTTILVVVLLAYASRMHSNVRELF